MALLDIALIGTMACVNELLHLATPLGLIAGALGARGMVHAPVQLDGGHAAAPTCSTGNGSCSSLDAVLSLAPGTSAAESPLSSAAALLVSSWGGGAGPAWRSLRRWLETKLQFWLVLASTLGLLLPGLLLLLLTVPVRPPMRPHPLIAHRRG